MIGAVMSMSSKILMVVEAVNIQNCNLDDSEKARAFKNSIERAVYKASPLPSSPDDAVFDREILFYFGVN